MIVFKYKIKRRVKALIEKREEIHKGWENCFDSNQFPKREKHLWSLLIMYDYSIRQLKTFL